MNKFYITTPIYYVNDKPHIGHAYTTIVADVLARYWRLRGSEVIFLTGTDENSQKNVEAAEKAGEEVKSYIDRMSAVWQETWDSLGLTNDDFIRTTEDRHHKAVEEFWKRVEKSGDIYLGKYEGWYCVGCEAFVIESELNNGNCPIHKKPAERYEQENFFFKLTKYREALLKYIEENPYFIQPVARRNEITNYIKDFMQDVSISRQSTKWGIPVPATELTTKDDKNKTQAIYVWFDALINYLSGVGFGTDEEKFEKFWPADLHLVGKDIIKFHCALWPAMLMSAKLELPKHVFAHGFFTINGDKISKSLGNAIDPVELANEYGIDAIRYYLLKDIHFGEDGDFSNERLKARYENELANDLGNLLHRVLSMTEKYTEGKIPAKSNGEIKTWNDYDQALEEFRLHDSLEAVWSVIRDANKLIEQSKPWELAKTDLKKLNEILYNLLETLRHVGWMLLPIMPETAQKILNSLGLDEAELKKTYEQAKEWGGLPENGIIMKGEPLFPKKGSL